MKMKEVANESLDVNSEKMKSNEERIEKAMKDLKSLSRINEMVDQILEITSQTNLLSLKRLAPERQAVGLLLLQVKLVTLP